MSIHGLSRDELSENIDILSKPDFEIYKWKLDPDDLDKWRRLNDACPKDQSKDCAVNVASFLKIIDRNDAEIIAENKNIMQMGTLMEDSQEAIYNKMDDKSFKKTIINVPILFNKNAFQLIRNKVGEGYLTVMHMYMTHNVGHSVIIGVMHNEVIVIDPQQQLIYYESNGSLINFTKDWPISFLHFKNRGNKRILETSSIRKPNIIYPSFKRTRRQSPIPIDFDEPMEIDAMEISKKRKRETSSIRKQIFNPFKRTKRGGYKKKSKTMKRKKNNRK